MLDSTFSSTASEVEVTTAPAAPDNRLWVQKLVFALLVGISLVAAGHLLVWMWGQVAGSRYRVLTFGVFLSFLALPLYHLLMAWYLAFRFRPRGHRPPRRRYRVDVFITAVDEPPEMVEAALRAAVGIRYPHETWLLDDGGNPGFETLARRLGARYLARPGREDLKAGNVNAALRHARGELVAIFDVDHCPEPDFLDRTVGFFDDPQVGFVQAMVTFANRDAGLLAQASAETALDYYNVTAVGKDRCGGASLMGSNAVIRRRALDQAGLYRPGLAEDLETSLALHAGGWKSVYVREPLAPGMAPADLPAFLKQQLKWASGVFEAGLGSLRGDFFKLDFHQKLCYATRFTYYLLGALVFVNMSLVALTLFWPVFDIETLTLQALPLSVMALLTRVYPLRVWGLEPAARCGLLVKGVSLFASAWPAYFGAALCALLRRRIPFIPTPKRASRRLPFWSWAPQLAMIALLLGGIAWRAAHWSIQPLPVTVTLALVLIGTQWILFVALFDGLRRKTAVP